MDIKEGLKYNLVKFLQNQYWELKEDKGKELTFVKGDMDIKINFSRTSKVKYIK